MRKSTASLNYFDDDGEWEGSGDYYSEHEFNDLPAIIRVVKNMRSNNALPGLYGTPGQRSLTVHIQGQRYDGQLTSTPFLVFKEQS